MNLGSRHLKRLLRRLGERFLEVRAMSSDGSSVAILGGLFFRHRFARLYLGRDLRIRFRYGIRLVSSRKALPRLARRWGLAVCPAQRFPGESGLFSWRVPSYLCLSVDLPPSREDYFENLGSSVRGDLRRVRHQHFQFSLSRDQARIEDFLCRFHLPTVQVRYGREAVPATLRDLRKVPGTGKAELLQIFRDGTWVGGCIACEEQDAYRMLHLGWLRGDPQLLKDGIAAGIYKSCIERTYELGRRTLVLGGTEPFLEDGVLAYKAKWGGRIDVSRCHYSEWNWYFNPGHPHFRRFIHTRSVLVRTPGDTFDVYSAKRPPRDSAYAPFMKSVQSWYRLKEERDVPWSGQEFGPREDLFLWFEKESLEEVAQVPFQG